MMQTKKERNREKRERGICYDCPAPVVDGRTRCATHLLGSQTACKKYMKTERGKALRKANEPANYAASRAHGRVWKRAHGRFKYVKNCTVQRGKVWTLSEPEYFAAIAGPCAYCGLTNDVEAGTGLDRLDNAKGYEPGNVVSCCNECNRARGALFTPDEMRVIGAAIATVKLARRKAAE